MSLYYSSCAWNLKSMEMYIYTPQTYKIQSDMFILSIVIIIFIRLILTSSNVCVYSPIFVLTYLISETRISLKSFLIKQHQVPRLIFSHSLVTPVHSFKANLLGFFSLKATSCFPYQSAGGWDQRLQWDAGTFGSRWGSTVTCPWDGSSGSGQVWWCRCCRRLRLGRRGTW